jgi:2-methylisocitrate lyase-like PEP mutase family enzyme
VPSTTKEKRDVFRKLHERGCFVLPNPWDIGSARMFQQMGFVALASTSSGFAWSTGRPDYAVTRDEILEHLASLSSSVDLPVNADFESGFASEVGALAKNVTLAVRTGVAGISIEDRKIDKISELYASDVAVERLVSARRAIDQTGESVVLVARTEGLLIDPAAVTIAIDKLVAFADAGADCLYAPGVREKSHIEAMVRAVAPKPLNVLVMGPGLSVAQLADLGVRRISVGGALARVGWGSIKAAAEQIRAGSFETLTSDFTGAQLNKIFDRSLQD